MSARQDITKSKKILLRDFGHFTSHLSKSSVRILLFIYQKANTINIHYVQNNATQNPTFFYFFIHTMYISKRDRAPRGTPPRGGSGLGGSFANRNLSYFLVALESKSVNLNIMRKHTEQKNERGKRQLVKIDVNDIDNLNRQQRRALKSKKQSRYRGLTRPNDNGLANGGKKRYG